MVQAARAPMGVTRREGGQVDGAPVSRYLPILLIGASLLAIFAAALWMRLYGLGLPYQRDYDEGVYWQTLRALAVGYPLYEPVFFSQPPFFMLSVYPAYALLGESIWSARLGIAVVSLFGVLGAVLMGRALAGYPGATLAGLLVVADDRYLWASQTLQAEAPSVAFSFLAVGLACLWWTRRDGTTSHLLAALCASALALGILSKLLAVTALVPIGLIVLSRLWLIGRMPRQQQIELLLSLAVGLAFLLATTALVMLPFIGSFPEMWQGVVTYHLDAEVIHRQLQEGNLVKLQELVSESYLVPPALFGAVAAVLRRDRRALLLVAWFAVSVYLLWRQTPLFPHHYVILGAPLIALTVIGTNANTPLGKPRSAEGIARLAGAAIAFLLAIVASYQGLSASWDRLRYEQMDPSSTRECLQVAADLNGAVRGDDLVITDAQFFAAMADRSTPASLTDTSGLRIGTGYLKEEDVIREASQPQVGAVLFYGSRLREGLPGFYAWVADEYQLARDYGDSKELWVRRQDSPRSKTPPAVDVGMR